ncbi:MAG: hypothetical protein ABEI57_07680 [Halapricum sp.]
MGRDGLIDLDQDCWLVVAKYNLLLATLFGALTVGMRVTVGEQSLLVVQNAIFAVLFGGIQTYAWLSA